jgi:phospholipase A1
MKRLTAIFLIAACATATRAGAQNTQENRASASNHPVGPQCAQLSDDPAARLACFDRWARQQDGAAPAPAPSAAAAPVPAALAAPAEPQQAAAIQPDCHDSKLSTLSRFWELEAASDCGRFNIRGYQPISLSWAGADSINTSPSSPTPGHTAAVTDYLRSEGRIQLSVRTKIGSGFLPVDNFGRRDSLWFGYSQQSYWQLFSASISRPFRVTDHEPELIYILPTEAELPLGWRLRYSGVSLNHQSNGQPLPLSRSWNRVILMAGMEKDQRFTLTGRVWQRVPEDAESDDNPEISDLVGRAEVSGSWNVNKDNTLRMTARHSLNSTANGSVRIEWLQTLGTDNRNRASGLRFHVQLFSGYGDSLLDYNYYRTVLNIGLSLVDW